MDIVKGSRLGSICDEEPGEWDSGCGELSKVLPPVAMMEEQQSMKTVLSLYFLLTFYIYYLHPQQKSYAKLIYLLN